MALTGSRFALVGGAILIAVPALVEPMGGLSPAAWRTAGLALAMALWWITEALPLAATALVPLAVAPIGGLSPLGDVARSYSDPLIILFLGGFLLAKAIERWEFQHRVAGWVLGLAGNSAGGILAAIMGATAFLSLWISNTASAMVMAPIAAAVAGSRCSDPQFRAALMLGVAYAATIGGMGSLIGTPPNAIFAAYVAKVYGFEVGFARWMLVGLPVSGVLLVVAWVVLARVTFALGQVRIDPGVVSVVARMTPPESRVAAIAALTALAWILRPVIVHFAPGLALSDAGIAMIAALALFMTPSGQGGRLLDWETAATLRWDVLILFGGGLALAGLIDETDLAGWIGLQLSGLQGLPLPAVVLVFAAIVVYTGELASNTAMAALFLPVASAAALGLGADPLAFLLPVALAASVGFMLPVATPPNAIVLAYPSVGRKEMLRAGTPLDIVGILVATGIGALIGPHVF